MKHPKMSLFSIVSHLLFTDIVYGIHAGGSVVNIPPSFRNLDIGNCKRPPDIPDTKWYCIVVGGWNSYIKILNTPVGSMSSKLRHLQLLGYKPVVVSYIFFKFRSLFIYSTDEITFFHSIYIVSLFCIFRFHGLNGNNCLQRNKKST